MYPIELQVKNNCFTSSVLNKKLLKLINVNVNKNIKTI